MGTEIRNESEVEKCKGVPKGGGGQRAMSLVCVKLSRLNRKWARQDDDQEDSEREKDGESRRSKRARGGITPWHPWPSLCVVILFPNAHIHPSHPRSNQNKLGQAGNAEDGRNTGTVLFGSESPPRATATSATRSKWESRETKQDPRGKRPAPDPLGLGRLPKEAIGRWLERGSGYRFPEHQQSICLS